MKIWESKKASVLAGFLLLDTIVFNYGQKMTVVNANKNRINVRFLLHKKISCDMILVSNQNSYIRRFF